MLRFIRTVTIALVLPIAAGAQGPALNSPLPFDPKVTVGKLPNGLTYYIRQNAKPEKRAELRLVVNVGSIHEEDNQRGYAHFVEHMGFNGTRHFRKNELIDYLQSIGLSFGAHVNAYTSYDETVYNLTIPTDTARIVDKAFQVLGDWAHGQVFDAQMVVSERGVVLEEWRGGKGVGSRMSEKTTPIVLKGSRYAVRSPIGSDTSIQATEAAGLKAFYEKWYRPDLMAVVAVGDFDKARIESLIKEHFGEMKPVANPAPKPPAPIPDNVEPLIALVADKEMTSTYISVGFKRRYEPGKNVGDYRRGMIEGIYLDMINDRLYEPTRKPNAPYRSASMSLGSFAGRELDVFTLSASVNDGGMERGLEAILTESKRTDQFGFLQSELDRVRTNLLRGLESSYADRENRTHSSYVGAYISHFFYGTTPISDEYRYEMRKQILPTITLAEVNGLATKWITDENRVIRGGAPEKPGVRLPTDREILAVFDKAARATVTAYTETVADGPLLPNPPTPGRVTSERTVAEIGVTEWQLSNGSRVLVKPTTFKNDEILFTGSSAGGLSLIIDKDYHSAVNAAGIVGASGAGRFNSIDLGKKLTGKAAGASFSISSFSEGVSGSASPKDLETMFELLYLRLTEPRIDTSSWLATKERALTNIANRDKNPAAAFLDTVVATMSQNDPRSKPLTAEALDSVDLGRALAIFKERFSDFSDYTFAFVGNVKLDELKPLVEKYLASLPVTGRKETWKPFGNPPPTGVIEKVVQKGIEQRAATQFVFTGPFQYSAENQFVLGALINVLQTRLTDLLREQLGAVYTTGVSGGGGRIPREEYSINIVFPSSPGNVARLSRAVMAAIDTLQTRGPSKADIDKVKELYTRSRETSVKQNGYWLGAISSREETSIDSVAIKMKLSEERVKKLSVDQIRDAAKLYFNLKNYAKFVWFPEIVQ